MPASDSVASGAVPLLGTLHSLGKGEVHQHKEKGNEQSVNEPPRPYPVPRSGCPHPCKHTICSLPEHMCLHCESEWRPDMVTTSRRQRSSTINLSYAWNRHEATEDDDPDLLPSTEGSFAVDRDTLVKSVSDGTCVPTVPLTCAHCGGPCARGPCTIEAPCGKVVHLRCHGEHIDQCDECNWIIIYPFEADSVTLGSKIRFSGNSSRPVPEKLLTIIGESPGLMQLPVPFVKDVKITEGFWVHFIQYWSAVMGLVEHLWSIVQEHCLPDQRWLLSAEDWVKLIPLASFGIWCQIAVDIIIGYSGIFRVMVGQRLGTPMQPGPLVKQRLGTPLPPTPSDETPAIKPSAKQRLGTPLPPGDDTYCEIHRCHRPARWRCNACDRWICHHHSLSNRRRARCWDCDLDRDDANPPSLSSNHCRNCQDTRREEHGEDEASDHSHPARAHSLSRWSVKTVLDKTKKLYDVSLKLFCSWCAANDTWPDSKKKLDHAACHFLMHCGQEGNKNGWSQLAEWHRRH